MLDKALQQPDGKISDKVLYAEEDVKYLCYEAFLDGMAYASNSNTDGYYSLNPFSINNWWEKHKKH